MIELNKLDFIEVQKHINILNVAYHLCLEIVDNRGYEHKAICPFCGYNKNSKIPTLSLNSESNKYCCSRCGKGGYSVGLYAQVKGIDNTSAFKELLKRECFSVDKSHIEISPINILADIDIRDKIYREFLNMLKLEGQHRKMLNSYGFLDSSIDNGLYKTAPKNYIKRRLVAYNLSKKFNLAGIPGLFQEEDFKWCFSRYTGFFVPVFDENNKIKALSIHLDKSFNNNQDLWFSSSGKINGTGTKNYIMEYNIKEDSKNLILTDNFLLGNLIKETTDTPIIAFQNISNSYMILKEIENTQIQNIIFALRVPQTNNNLDYIIRRVFRDLIPLGYNLDTKLIYDYKDILKEDFMCNYRLKKVA